MLRLLPLLCLLLSLCLCLLPSAEAQTPLAIPISGGPILTPFGTPASNAPLRVCLSTAIGTPCSTTGVTLFADQFLTQPLSNPFHLNSQGVYNVFAPAGNYIVQVQATATTLYTFYVFQQGGTPGPQGPPGPTGPPGTGTIVASPQFSLFYQPNPGSASAAQGDPNVTTDGSGNVTGISLKAQVVAGSRYAVQWQTGGGNNGIANALATNQTVVADPSYPTTEQYTVASLTAIAPNFTHFKDLRSGIETNYFSNWGYAANNLGDGRNAALFIPCNNTINPTATGSVNHTCQHIVSNDSVVGIDYGGAPVGPTGWYFDPAIRMDLTSWSLGIGQGYSSAVVTYSAGDKDGVAVDMTSSGGYRAAADQGVAALVGNTHEYAFTALGTCATGCTSGSQQIKGTMVGNVQGIWRTLIDTTQTPISDTITLIAAGLNGGSTITTSSTHGASNAWGTLNGNCVAPQVNTFPFSSSVTCAIVTTSGTFDTTHLMCFKGGYHEQVIPTAASPTSITMLLRMSHPAGSEIMQGGMCGYNAEPTAFTHGVLRYAFDCVGSTSTTTAECGLWAAGANMGTVTIPASAYQCFNLGVTSSNGNTVTANYPAGTCLSAGQTLASPTLYNGASIVIAGTSTAMDGTCTNMTWLTATTFQCTKTGVGTASAASGTASLGQSAINFWPGAQTLDVMCETCTPPIVDGSFALEPNNVNWTPGDNIEQMHDISSKYVAGYHEVDAVNPFTVLNGMTIAYTGSGADGGNNNAAVSNDAIHISSLQPNNYYRGQGGSAIPPNRIDGVGPMNIGWNESQGPMNGQPFINIAPVSAQLNDFNYSFPFLQTGNKSGTSSFVVNPFLGSWNIAPTGVLQIGGFATVLNQNIGFMRLNDELQFAVMATPAAPTLTAFTSGGNPAGAGVLTDATQFCYKIAARNNAGTGIASTETCVTTGSSGNQNSIKVVWPHVSGATVYNICRGATGAESQMTTTNGIDNTTFFDSGLIAPSGACSSTDTTLGFIDSAAKVGLHSSGTAFETNLTSQASIAATFVESMPETATVGSLVDKLSGATVSGDIATFSNATGRIQDSGTLLSSLTSPTKVSTSITPAAATASQCVEQTFTFTGLTTAQGVHVSPPASLGAHIWIGSTRVSASNTLAIAFCGDATAGTPPSGTYIAVAF